MCALEEQSSKGDGKNWKSKFSNQSHSYGPAGAPALKMAAQPAYHWALSLRISDG